MKGSIIVAGVCLLFILGCSQKSDQEYLKEAEDSLKTSNYQAALSLYNEILNKTPKSDHRLSALYAIGTIYQNYSKDFPRSIKYYRMAAIEYPDSGKAVNALFLCGFLYHNELKQLDSARAVYSEFLQKYPAHELALSAKYELENLGKNPNEIITPAESKPLAAKSKKKK
ncbi:MAG: tetratricopeptide repeat protein [bacterium]